MRLALDPSGTLAICACVDGSVTIYDLTEGRLLARSGGCHGDTATGVMLTEDLKR